METAYQRQEPNAKPMLEPIMKGKAVVPVRVAENIANTMPNMAAVVVPAIMLRNMLCTTMGERGERTLDRVYCSKDISSYTKIGKKG